MKNKEEVIELVSDNDNTVNVENTIDVSNDRTSLDVVVDGIEYEFTQEILVKPLDKIMLVKEVTTMTEQKDDEGKVVRDESGAVQYDTVTEEKEVASVWRKGIVLALPNQTVGMKLEEFPCKVGDTIVYNGNGVTEFDLFKTSILISPFSVRAVVKA